MGTFSGELKELALWFLFGTIAIIAGQGMSWLMIESDSVIINLTDNRLYQSLPIFPYTAFFFRWGLGIIGCFIMATGLASFYRNVLRH